MSFEQYKEFIPFLVKAQNTGSFNIDGSLKVLETIDSINGTGNYTVDQVRQVIIQSLELGNANSKNPYNFDEIRVLKDIYSKLNVTVPEQNAQNENQAPNKPSASEIKKFSKHIDTEPKIQEISGSSSTSAVPDVPDISKLSESEIKELALKQLSKK